MNAGPTPPALLAALGAAISDIERMLDGHIPRRPRAELIDMLALLRATFDQATTLHEDLYRLPVELQRPLLAGHATWSALPPARYVGGSPELERLATQSLTLRELGMLGVHTRSVERFSSEVVALATSMALAFDGIQPAFRAWKRAVAKQHDTLRLRRGEAIAGLPFFEALHTVCGSDEPAFEVYSYGRKEWFATPADALRHGRNMRDKVRVPTPMLTKEWRRIVSGHWFTVLAYTVMEEHLEALGADYELLSNVEFESGIEFGRLRGDFDVLARTSDTLLLIECKSGRLTKDHQSFREIVDKARLVERVLEDAGAEIPVRSALLYNPYATEPDVVTEALEGTCVTALQPRELRRFVSQEVA